MKHDRLARRGPHSRVLMRRSVCDMYCRTPGCSPAPGFHAHDDQYPDGDGDEGKEERVLPAQNGDGAADSRVARGPDAQDACVVAHGGSAFPAGVEVANYGEVDGAQCGGAGPLQEAQDEEEAEVFREGAGAAEHAEDEKRRDEDLPPSQAVGEYAQDRGEEYSRK